MAEDDERRDDVARRIDRKVRRRMKRRAEKKTNAWFGIGTFGVVGWSVAVPTLVGLALGVWLDHHLGGKTSWTVALLLAGLTVGCLNAWYWVSRERRPEEER